MEQIRKQSESAQQGCVFKERISFVLQTSSECALLCGIDPAVILVLCNIQMHPLSVLAAVGSRGGAKGKITK